MFPAGRKMKTGTILSGVDHGIKSVILFAARSKWSYWGKCIMQGTEVTNYMILAP